MSTRELVFHTVGWAGILYMLGHLIYSMSGHPREWMRPLKVRR